MEIKSLFSNEFQSSNGLKKIRIDLLLEGKITDFYS